MSQKYDNWERLVGAVLLREHFRQIALRDSRSPSSISSPSSSSDLSITSSSRIDHDHPLVHRDRIQVPMDYSDLTLDHSEWKTMLPPDKQEVVWRSASLSFFLDQRTGKNCFMVGATKLVMSQGVGFEHKSHPKSRFSEVAELRESLACDIRGRIHTEMLSPETFYAAYLVFELTEGYRNSAYLASSIYRSLYDESDDDYPRGLEREVHLQSSHARADGWMEVEMGDFYVSPGDNQMIEARLLIGCMSGLIVEGIEFRPLEERLVIAVLRKEQDRQIALNHSRDRIQVPMDYSDLKLDHSKWKTMLPPDKQEVVWRSASLSFSLDQRTGKNCFMLGATKLVMSPGEEFENNWERKSHPKSRFSEVAELTNSWGLDIRGRINTQMLSPETFYAAHLVFVLAESYKNLASGISIVRFLYDESDYNYRKEQARIVHFQSGNARADGWMEVEMGACYVRQGHNGMIQAQLLETSGYWKSGLIVEGIEFRPSEGKKNSRAK